ncbi:MAG: alpha/beta fold hydrolase [Pseudobdellovibrionaceae bacterium]
MKIKIGDDDIFYQQSGSGPDLVMIHGLGASHFVWRKLIPLLQKDFRIATLDLVGYGQSATDAHISYSLKSQTERVEKFVEALSLKNVVLVGSSMGGTLSLSLAAKRPDLVRGVVAIAPAYFYFPKWGHFLVRFFIPVLALYMNPTTLRLFVNQVVNKFQSFDENEFLVYMKCYLKPRTAVEVVIRSIATITDSSLLKSLAEIRAPCLLLWGKRDRVNLFWNHRNLTSRLKSVKLFTHPWAGHHIMEDDANWTEDRIREFISGLSS